MLELILSKKSSESEIKSYFNAVLELSKSDNEFPINLDEVWMLVYGRKEEAVRALTSSEQFIENIDYQVLRKNAEMLESATVETARQVERSVVDIETLRGVHAKLISTIEETLRIAQEGREQRLSAEKELVVMEQDLRGRLTALAASKTETSVSAALGQTPAVEAAPSSAALGSQTQAGGTPGATDAESPNPKG